MKITVDTNVLISATFWYGDSNEIIERAENKEFEIILSKDIIQEYLCVLNYKEIQDKIKNKNLEMRKTAEKIMSISTIIEPNQKVKLSNDPDDNKILECASAGKVDFIITNDNHLLKLKEFNKIRIVTPNEFLKGL